MNEAWATDDELRAARERFAATISGWNQPVLHGTVTTDAHGAKTVRVVSGVDHRLPAIVLSTVIGHSSGSETIVVSSDQLQRAAGILAPAEAATHVPHPNLWAWRANWAENPALIEAVFVDDLSDEISSEADRLLRSTSL